MPAVGVCLQTAGPCHPAVRQRGRCHQADAEEDRPAVVQGLLGTLHRQPEGAKQKGAENCVSVDSRQGVEQ